MVRSVCRAHGDVQAATCLKIQNHQHIPAGVEKIMILAQSPVCRLTLVVKRVASFVCSQKNALILANYFVMLAHALHALTLVPFKSASVAKIQHRSDVLILITTLVGVADITVAI